MIEYLIFAARRGDDTAFTAVLVLILLVVAIFALVREASASYHVVTKRGIPYCPKCNRQISYRRDYCRACNYQFKTYGRSPKDLENQAAELRAIKRRDEARSARLKAEIVIRKIKREEYYRSKGIEPGPFAWFWAMSDFGQLGVFAGLMAALGLAVVGTAIWMKG